MFLYALGTHMCIGSFKFKNFICTSALTLVYCIVILYQKLAGADKPTTLLLADILYPQTISQQESRFGLAMHQKLYYCQASFILRKFAKSKFGSTQILRILSQKTILEGSQDPANMRCHYLGGSKFSGSWESFKIVFRSRFLKN